MKKKEISLMSLLAYCINERKKIIIVGLLLALVLGGYRTIVLVSAFLDETRKAEEEYVEKQKTYELEKELLEMKLAFQKRNLEESQSYLIDSILMEIDPYNEYISTIDYSIDLQNDDDYKLTVEYNTTPINYMIARIQKYYAMIWNTLDAEEILREVYPNSADKYIKEIVSVSMVDGGVVEITAIANTEVESEKATKLVLDYLLSQQERVTESTYEHRISVISSSVKNRVDSNLADKQKRTVDSLESLTKQIDEISQAIKQLKAPGSNHAASVWSIVMSVCVFLIIGLFVGGVLTAIVIMGIALISNSILNTKEIEEFSNVRHIGTVIEGKNYFGRIVGSLAGDRTWDTNQDALEYIYKVGIKQGQSYVILSTIKERNDDMSHVIDYLQEKGIKVTLLTDALRNPDVIEKVNGVDRVIIIEKMGHTKLSDLININKEVRRLNKDIEGLIWVI